MLLKLISEVNIKFNKNFSAEEFSPVYNADNDGVDWINVWDTGLVIIRLSPSGKIGLIEADFLTGKCTKI